MSITPTCCQACLSCASATSALLWLEKKIACGFSRSSGKTSSPIRRPLSASFHPSIPAWILQKKCATAYSKPRNTFRSINSAPPTTAVSPLSATTLPPLAKPPSPKFAPASKALTLRKGFSESSDEPRRKHTEREQQPGREQPGPERRAAAAL